MIRARQIEETIERQRAAIIRGDYSEAEAIVRIEPLLRRLSEKELGPISESLRRNLELLGIAKETLQEVSAKPDLRIYAPDGSMKAMSAAPSTLFKR